MLNLGEKIIITIPIILCYNIGLRSQERPNLVFVFADQLRQDVLGYSGDKKAITPNIDTFARESFNMSNAVSVSPVSAPMRSSLFTGKYISSTGMVINELNMNPNHKTWAHVLNENGYKCGYVGKMHLNDVHSRSFKKGPERFGFDDYWAGYSFNHLSYNAYYYTDDSEGNEIKVDLSGRYGPQEFTTLACDYIEKASKRKEPFALVLSWNPPHDPWVKSNVLPECYDKFKDVHFDLPENYNENPDPYMDRYNSAYFVDSTKWKNDFIHGKGYQETLRCYYAMVNSIDYQFGRILKKLKELGIDDNTIVVFTSDHGEMFGSHGRMYKMTFYEEASRVPFLVRFPDKIKPGKSDVCINTPDIYPTLLGLMGLSEEIPKEVEGKDLSFVLLGEKGEEPEFAFMQGMGHTYLWRDGYEWRAVRDKEYCYARYLKDGKELLFNIKNDPHEKQNLADNPQYKDVLLGYRNKMSKRMSELNDDFKPCTWYRDHWMYKNFSIQSSARGEFGPLPPIEPNRKK